jgi:23S rRNA pseudouridine2605 synthase
VSKSAGPLKEAKSPAKSALTSPETRATKLPKSPKPQAEPEAPKGTRLQKILADAGLASRRKAEELILEGRVQVNGAVVTELGTRADAVKDHIRVDGKLLQGPQEHRYFMVNKPRGYVTTMDDPEHRDTVVDLLKESARLSGKKLDVRLYPVGRLDYNSEGLLLMTNDGELANSLSKASNSVEKTYLVKVAGRPEEAALDQLRHGVMIDRGRLAEARGTRRDRVMTAPARVTLARGGENPWYEVTLTEGRNRQLRKMFEEIGHHVEKIRRIGYGALVLDVPTGEFRELTPGEVMALGRAAAGKSVERKKKLPEAAKLKQKGQKTGSRGARPRF